MSKITNDDDNRVSNEVACCIASRNAASMHSDHFENKYSFIKWLTRNLYFFPGFTPITSLSFWTAINNSLAMGVKGGRAMQLHTLTFLYTVCKVTQNSAFSKHKSLKKTEPIFVITIYFGLFLRVKLYLKHDKRFYFCEYVLTLKYEACRRITLIPKNKA